MKNKSAKVNIAFLLLCTFLSVVISLSGTVLINDLTSLIFQLLFLPVTVYLLITSINVIFFKGKNIPDMHFATSKAFITISLITFVIISVFVVKNIRSKQTSDSVQNKETNTTVIKVNTDKTNEVDSSEIDTEIKEITLYSDIPNELISIRENPTENAKIIKQGTTGAKFELLSETDEWYEIKIDENKNGWVKKIYTK